MIVDDDRTMLGLLRTLLELEGFEVVHTGRGQVAPAMVRDERPELVLIDVHLADGDGLEVLRQIRADPDLTKSRVVMSSGMDVYQECMRAGSDGFILKPYTLDQLLSAVNRALER